MSEAALRGTAASFTSPHGPIVVGVDSSSESWSALAWAIEEATRRDTSLHLVHSCGDALASRHARSAGQDDSKAMVVLANAIARACSLSADLVVTAEVSHRTPSDALVRASRSASCVVVGTRGRHQLVGSVLGTTSAEVSVRSACPVVVVHRLGKIESVRPSVVVGTDGSGDSSRAIGYAFAQASERALPLTLVHACPPPSHGCVAFRTRTDLVLTAAREQAATAREVAAWSASYPDVDVRRHVLRADPVTALIDHSRGAELLVVGSRGFRGWSAMAVGSVSQALLGRAHCPVAVVRSRRS